MSKKIFIVTGEPSGDRLASKVISKLKKNNNNIEFLSVGGTHLKSIGVNSILTNKNTAMLIDIIFIKVISIVLPDK